MAMPPSLAPSTSKCHSSLPVAAIEGVDAVLGVRGDVDHALRHASSPGGALELDVPQLLAGRGIVGGDQTGRTARVGDAPGHGRREEQAVDLPNRGAGARVERPQMTRAGIGVGAEVWRSHRPRPRWPSGPSRCRRATPACRSPRRPPRGRRSRWPRRRGRRTAPASGPRPRRRRPRSASVRCPWQCRWPPAGRLTCPCRGCRQPRSGPTGRSAARLRASARGRWRRPARRASRCHRMHR